MRTTANQAANVAGSKIADMFNRHFWDHVLDLDEMIWWRSKEVDTDGNIIVPFKLGALPTGLIALVAMWLLNLLTDWAGTYGTFWPAVGSMAFFASFLIGFGGYIAIWRQIAKPRNIRFGAFVFATLNIFQWKNPVRGAITGGKTVLDLTGVIGLYYLFASLVLWTWGFSNSPMAFWVGLAAIIVLTSLGAGRGIRMWVMTIYAAGVLLMALGSTIGDVYQGKSFDSDTGAPLYMVDPTTGRIDSEGRRPEDCKAGKCFSAETGQKLRPMTKEEALKRNPAGIADKAIAGISSINFSDVSLGGSDCSDHVHLVEHGMRITVTAGCLVKVDQMNMRNGTDFKLVDPALRAVTGRQQLVTMDPGKNNRFVTLQANAEGLRRYGRTAVEVELYHAGTGDAEVARRYGVVTPNIDLTPARQ